LVELEKSHWSESVMKIRMSLFVCSCWPVSHLFPLEQLLCVDFNLRDSLFLLVAFFFVSSSLFESRGLSPKKNIRIYGLTYGKLTMFGLWFVVVITVYA